MISKLRLKNFRNWKSVEVELKPLTILLGRNSAGKTSLLQPLRIYKAMREVGSGCQKIFQQFDSKFGSFSDLMCIRGRHEHEQKINMGFDFLNENVAINVTITDATAETVVEPIDSEKFINRDAILTAANNFENFHYLGAKCNEMYLTPLPRLKEGSVILCEHPEAYLHPIAQSGLGDLFVTTVIKRSIQMLIETHSEHIFRRLQCLIAEGVISHTDCAIYYVERNEDWSAKLTTLELDEYGRCTNWPKYLFGDALGETERQMKAIIERKRKERKEI